MATIPIKDNVDERPFEKLFFDLQDAVGKDDDGRITALESEIDRLVYQLYGLTYDEVLVVDPTPPFTREEYERETLE